MILFRLIVLLGVDVRLCFLLVPYFNKIFLDRLKFVFDFVLAKVNDFCKKVRLFLGLMPKDLSFLPILVHGLLEFTLVQILEDHL